MSTKPLTEGQVEMIHQIIEKYSTDVVDYEAATDDINAALAAPEQAEPPASNLSKPDWCDLCNAPQMVLANGEHVCSEIEHGGAPVEKQCIHGYVPGDCARCAAPEPAPEPPRQGKINLAHHVEGLIFDVDDADPVVSPEQDTPR